MTEKDIRINEETYIVHEKLDLKSYSVKTDPHTLNERTRRVRDAGVNLEFYAHIPQLEVRDEKALIRRYELDTDDKKERPVPRQFMNEVFEIDGLYLLSNIKTSDGRLKIVRQVKDGHHGSTELREMDDHWEIHLDPVTAELLGIKTANERPPDSRETNTVSNEILREIYRTRVKMGLRVEDIDGRIEDRKRKSKIR